MTSANDPFEEYLRKKKVELLEKKFKTRTDEDGEYRPPEDPQASARLQEEVDDFMNTASSAGAQHFSEAGSDLVDDDKVEEIKDALDGMFDEERGTPSTEAEDAGFVNFFKQVRTEYDADDPRSQGQPPAVEEPDAMESAVADAAAAEPAVADSPVADPAPATLPPVSAEEFVAVEVDDEDEQVEAFDIATVLAGLSGEDALEQRVAVLTRLVVKLVERAKLAESEIVEVLIKSGVEF
jgi:anti-sigma28 factor (negative regulator of flagellin synthesis)